MMKSECAPRNDPERHSMTSTRCARIWPPCIRLGYLTLIEGVSAVHITGVHPIDDQSVALRLVSLTDRLYDAGIPVVSSGTKLDTIFSAEMLAGGYRKKYLRATSRLLALTAMT